MILVDTSAWVEFLRDTGSPVCERVDALLDDDLAVCDPIRMEVLAGARDETHLGDLRRLLARGVAGAGRVRPLRARRRPLPNVRRNGDTVRKLIDCLIAAAAIDADLPVLHADKDLDRLARHTALRVVVP